MSECLATNLDAIPPPPKQTPASTVSAPPPENPKQNDDDDKDWLEIDLNNPVSDVVLVEALTAIENKNVDLVPATNNTTNT